MVTKPQEDEHEGRFSVSCTIIENCKKTMQADLNSTLAKINHISTMAFFFFPYFVKFCITDGPRETASTVKTLEIRGQIISHNQPVSPG